MFNKPTLKFDCNINYDSTENRNINIDKFIGNTTRPTEVGVPTRAILGFGVERPESDGSSL